MEKSSLEQASRPRRRTVACALALLIAGPPLSPAVIVVDGTCSLADAIESANTNSAVGGCASGAGGPDTLQLTANVALTSVLPAITSSVTLEGGGFEIRRQDTAPDFRILELQSGADVRLEDVTISNGRSVDGGGIFHDGDDLTLVNTTVTGNVSSSMGGGIYIAWNGFGATRLYNSTVSGNTTTTFGGGGIYSGDYADLRLTGTTVSGNVATGRGGGIASGNYTTLKLVNSTISGNVSGDDGGGINHGYGFGDVVLENSTVVGNIAAGPVGGIHYDAFGSSDLSLSNSIVAANSGLNCLYPTPVDLGGNFDDDGSCSVATIVPGVDFDLALTDNGGPTETHRLFRDSVAIDAGVDCQHPLDQRGFDRDPPCDSGSVEFGVAPVGGSIDGLNGRDVTCRNLTTGTSVNLSLTGVQSWDCEAAGLTVGLGERVELTINARVVDGAAGSIIGFTGRNAVCGNLTSGDRVAFSIEASAAWSCEDEGLAISAGDRLRIVVNGSPP